MTRVEWTVGVSRTPYTQKTSHKEHLAIDKDEIKLWSKMPNSKNIELRSQGK